MTQVNSVLRVTARQFPQQRTPRVWIGILMLALIAVSCQNRFGGKPETIRLGLFPLEQNALIYIAEQEGLFAQNNVNIAVRDYNSGVATVDALLKGDVDISESSEFPFVGAALRQEPISIVVTNDKFENDYLVGRQDRGINNVADLKGKRIGLTRGTITEFLLGRMLELNGIKLEDVTLVDVAPGQFVSALADAEIDALVAWQPYVHDIEKQVDSVVVLPAQSNQPVYGVLVGSNTWLKQHPGLVVDFLRSLGAAEDWAVLHPEQARAIVKQRLHYDDAYITSIWSKHHFALSLDYSLIVAMTNEARWMIQLKLSQAAQAPAFVDYIYPEGLAAVKPETVNIVR